jgi:DNA (cytosine-5)-methyltransferase 1
MRFYDGFCGVGGFHLGIKQAHPDWECVGACEIDKYARKVYKHHFPEVHIDEDIRKLEKLPDGTDLFCGGFPCQSFSIAGKRGGFNDTRGTLFFEIARLAKASKPKLLFLENVKGLLNHDEGKTFATILRTLDELGYDAQWEVLNSKNFGVPQNRERVFIIANLGTQRPPPVFPIGEDSAEADELQRHANSLTSRYEQAQATGTYIREQFPQEEASVIGYTRDGTGKEISYHEKQIAGTLKGATGNQREYIKLQDGNKAGYSTAYIGDGINLAFGANRKKGRGRVLKGRAPALQTGGAVGTVVPVKGDLLTRNNPQRQGEIGSQSVHDALRSAVTHGVAIPVLTPDRHEKRQNGRRFKTDGEPMFTLNTQDKHGVCLDNLKIRRLTPTECHRLQGFSDDWCKVEGNSETQQYKQLGNAVTVPVIKAIAERLI